MNNFFQKNWIHFAVIALFFIVTYLYFQPQFDGYGLKQHDIEQYKGMSHETQNFRDKTGEEPLWTNSMFGGMPTAQISVIYPGNIFQKITIGFIRFLGGPGAIVLIHLIGFYILGLCLRIHPVIAVFGAIAVSFSSYEIIILQAGHNSKAIAVAFMAPVVGAFLMAYRKNWKWGVIISAIFMSFELAANHLQVTYYMAILLLALGGVELFQAFKDKKLKSFIISSSALIGAYLLAFLINYGNISITNDYAKHTIRGKNEITINPNGTEASQQSAGLDKDYITRWSYGKGESFTLLSPYVKGSSTVALGNSPFVDITDKTDLTPNQVKAAMDMAVYWGDQPMTSGPVFIGVIVIFLSLLGLVYLKDRSKWVLLGVAILCLMLSWGKNFMGLTDFFIEYVPGYNKFRTVTIILVIVEFCLPLLAVFFLHKLYLERETIKLNKKPFLITSGIFFVFLIGLKVIGLGDNFTSASDADQLSRYRDGIESQIYEMDPSVLLQQYKLNVSNPNQVAQFVDAQMNNVQEGFDAIKTVRKEIYNSSMMRSIIFFTLLFGLLSLLFYTSTNVIYVYVGLSILLLFELVPVDLNYLNNETSDNGQYKYWEDKAKIEYPISVESSDEQILLSEVAQNPKLGSIIEKAEKEGEAKAIELEYVGEDKRRLIASYKFSALNENTNYRVFDFSGAFNSARASYYHKSLGGYHGAKLRNIQNLFDFHLSQSNNNVYDMMNVKYFIQEGKVRSNQTALGNAWMVKNVKGFETANEEILALGNTFELENKSTGKLLINGEVKTKATVYGSEKMQYLNLGKDTLTIRLPNGLSKGMKALFVMDVNGQTNLIPVSTLELDTANSFTSLVGIDLNDDFYPKSDAVMLNSEKSKLSKSVFTGEGQVKLTKYAPNQLNYESESNDKQLIVFSEIYYPEGWKAFLDGKEQEILKVNYLLRGLEVEKGKHKIEFKFDLPKYHTSNTLSIIGSLLILLLIAFGFYTDRKKTQITPNK
jgi:hypothetical protein